MQIVIFDDESNFRRKLEKILIPVLHTHDFVALSTGSVKEVNSYIQHNQTMTVYFLDLVVKREVIGLDLAETVKNKSPADIVVFVTAYADRILYTSRHKMLSLNIVIKDSPRFHQEICETIEKIRLFSDRGNSLVLDNRYGDIFKVYYADIYYIETIKSSHKIRIYYKAGNYEYRSAMKEIMDLLDKRFLRCHDSYIVNLDKILKIKKERNEVVLDNGMICFYSRKYKKLLSERIES